MSSLLTPIASSTEKFAESSLSPEQSVDLSLEAKRCLQVRQDILALQTLALEADPKTAQVAVYLLMTSPLTLDPINKVSPGEALLEIARKYDQRENDALAKSQALLVNRYLQAKRIPNFVGNGNWSNSVTFQGTTEEVADLRLFREEVFASHLKTHLKQIWTFATPEEIATFDSNLAKGNGIVKSKHLHPVLGEYSTTTTLGPKGKTVIGLINS